MTRRFPATRCAPSWTPPGARLGYAHVDLSDPASEDYRGIVGDIALAFQLWRGYSDALPLERHYRVAVDGTRAQWTLTLTPTDAALAAKVASIVLRGRADELRCIETTPVARGKAPVEVQRTLLGGAALAAQGVADASTLSALCRGTARG